ncbi:MAG: indolepyruvate oxidoreductase subunit beta [Thermodesulfobacteriota bacterium]
MEPLNIVLCGLGGQGILFVTKVLAETSLNKGYRVLGAETHGMAQRGGSVVSHLRIGEVESSLVRTNGADVLLALEEHEGYRNLPFLREGGRLYVNAKTGRFPRDDVKVYLDKRKVSYHSTPAGDLAMELGAPMSTNLALLGYYSAFEEVPATSSELRETIERITPDRFLEANLRVFDAGYKAGQL